MIKAFSFSIVIYSLLFLNSFVSDTNCFALSYLKKAGIKVEGTRLNGVLKNAPVKGVLKDLISGDGFACQVTGDLQGTVSMTIDNLTVEETLHRVMRNRRYDYTMILAEPGSPDGSDAAIRELTIYQNDKVVRFVKVPKDSVGDKPAGVAPVAKPVVPTSTETSVRTKAATGEELEQLDREINSLMDEMLTEEKMTRQEYDEALKSFSGEDR